MNKQHVKKYFRHFKRKIFIIFAVFGPGIITAFADNDAGGVATYTSAAAKFGYLSLTTLIPITIVLAVTQEVGARIAITTGKGLADLIREQFGIRKTVLVFFALFLVNYGVILQNLGGLKSALTLFHIDYRIFLPIILAFLFYLITKARYQKIQQFFLILIFFYLAYIISAVLAKPDWNLAVASLVKPPGKISFDYLFTSIAVLGTTVTIWGQFFISSYMKDKKINIESLPLSQWEILIGSILTNVFSFFMMIAVAATIFSSGNTVGNAFDAALAMTPLAGQFAGTLFGIGLFIAGLLGCAIVPLATSYAFSEFFGYQGTLNDGFQKSKLFYTFFLLQILLGAIVTFIPGVNLFQITLVADFFNGMLLPVLFYFLFQLANNKELMGTYKNSLVQNFLLVTSGLVISIGTVIGGIGKIAGW